MVLTRCLCLLGACVLLMIPTISGKDCKYGLKTVKGGQGILNGSCRLQLKCDARFGSLIAVNYRYRCPRDSSCKGFYCQCNTGYVQASTDSLKMLKSCRSASTCNIGGKIYKKDQEWLRSDCKYRYKCVSGVKKTVGRHKCPSNSYCSKGKCTCVRNHLEREVTYGVLRSCKPKACSVDHKFDYKYEEYALSSKCDSRWICDGSTGMMRKVSSFKCPANSSCIKRLCRCNRNYEQTMMSDDLKYILKCSLIQCKMYGKTFGNGDQWTSTDCKSKYVCTKEGEKKYSHRCPPNSHCNRGKCECDRGYKVKGTSSKGILESCESNSCKRSKKLYLTGEQWLDNYCTRYRCDEGMARPVQFQCPSNSDCLYGKCRCWPNAQPAVKDRYGITTGCGVPTCTDESKTYQRNEEWLNNACNKLFVCKEYGRRGGDYYRCPWNSKCDGNGKCVCDKGYGETTPTKKGVGATGCKPNTCQYATTTYYHGDEWYHKSTNCKVRFSCQNGSMKSRNSECPANSSCKNNNCECNPGYKETATDSAKLLSECGPA